MTYGEYLGLVVERANAACADGSRFSVADGCVVDAAGRSDMWHRFDRCLLLCELGSANLDEDATVAAEDLVRERARQLPGLTGRIENLLRHPDSLARDTHLALHTLRTVRLGSEANFPLVGALAGVFVVPDPATEEGVCLREDLVERAGLSLDDLRRWGLRQLRRQKVEVTPVMPGIYTLECDSPLGGAPHVLLAERMGDVQRRCGGTRLLVGFPTESQVFIAAEASVGNYTVPPGSPRVVPDGLRAAALRMGAASAERELHTMLLVESAHTPPPDSLHRNLYVWEDGCWTAVRSGLVI